MTNFGITDGPLDADTHVIEPHGEIDLATAPDLKAHLVRAIEDGRRFVVVDLEDVGFIDSTGLGVLLAIQRRLQAASGALTIVCTDALVLRVFEISGLVEVLNVQRSRKDALMWVGDFAATH